MARLISVLGVVLFGGGLAGACSESGSGVAEQEDAAGAQGFELLRRGAGSESSSLAVRASLHSLGSRLADLQADIIGDSARNGLSDSDPDDGSWDFLLPPTATSHSASASPENLYGVTGLVHWALLRSGSHNPRWHAASLTTALGAQNNALVDSPPDFVYLVLLSDLTEDAGFAELARTRYDAKLAGTGARALGERVRDQRHAQGNDGLIAYDLAWLTLGAAALDAAFPAAGYDADADAYAEVIVRDLSAAAPNFDYRDAKEAFYVQGLAWSLVALSRSNTAPELRTEVRTLLLDAQLPSGAWGWNAAYPSANLQATAESVQALALTQGARPRARRAEKRASNWLISQQAPNGGYLYTAALESPSLDAEVGLALFLAGTSAGARDGLSAEGVATAVQPLSAGGDGPPLSQPLSL